MEDENPTRYKKEIQSKLLKGLKRTDGIIIVGNATRTYERETNLTDYFDSCIYIPLPDYTMRTKLINHFMLQLGLEQYSLFGVAKDMRYIQ